MSEPPRELLANGDVIFDLAETARADAAALKDAPKMIRKTLEREAWRKFADSHSKVVFEYGPDDFEKFALAKRPGGLELPEGIKSLIGICELVKGDDDAAAALVMLREMVPKEAPQEIGKGKAGPGRGKKTDSVTTRLLDDRGSTYSLRRLKRDRPDLAEKVVHGQMSAHAAAVEAGFRARMVQVAPTVEGFRRAIERYLSPEKQTELSLALRPPTQPPAS